MAENHLTGKRLAITEKPSVARAIAAALPEHFENKDGYLESDHYLISWCVGHLVELATPGEYADKWVKWDIGSLPILPQEWKYDVKEGTSKQFEILKKLIHDPRVVSLINCGDCGREGELINRLVCLQAGCDKQIERLWISSMEEKAIREGFDHLKPSAEYDHLYQAALCRQRADWLVGINGTRLFTCLYSGKVLKVGRVQTPTLAMLTQREMEIRDFKKEPFYIVHLTSPSAPGLDAVSEHLKDKSQAESMGFILAGQTAIVQEIRKEEKKQKAPLLYDLNSLQIDANRILGFSAKQTLDYAQCLYEKKLLTYPRTDSRYLTDDMEQTARDVIAAVYQKFSYSPCGREKENIRCLLNSKRVTDHHALIPTMELIKADLSKLPASEENLLALVAARLLAATAGPFIYEATKAEITCKGYLFTAEGKKVLEKGWKEYEEQFRAQYVTESRKGKPDASDSQAEADRSDQMPDDSGLESQPFPDLVKGQLLVPVSFRVTEHMTAPPKHYNEASLLAAMEKAGASDMDADVERKGLGTPATRAEIIEKLIRDGFVRREKKNLVPTEDGINLISILPDAVKSVKLTSDWENDLVLVNKGEISANTFMAGIEEMVVDLVKQYRSMDTGNQGLKFPKEGALGTCPQCGKEIRKGKYGPYCTGKCGFVISKFMGVSFNDSQVKDLLSGKRILMKGLQSKTGKKYDAYLTPEGIESFSYGTGDGHREGYQYHFKMEFPDRKKKSSK